MFIIMTIYIYSMTSGPCRRYSRTYEKHDLENPKMEHCDAPPELVFPSVTGAL